MAVPIRYNEDVRNDLITVSTASVLVSPQKFRQELILTNFGTTTVTISIGKTAVAGAGIPLLPGGCYYSSVSQGFLPTQNYIYAIGSGVTTLNLSVFER